MSEQRDSPSVDFSRDIFPDILVPENLQKEMHSAALIWLHGLGGEPSGFPTQRFLQELTGLKYEHIKCFTPAAPLQPVTCNHGHLMPSWFNIQELPLRPDSKRSSFEDVEGVVKFVHNLLDKCISAGIPSSRIVMAGISQGAATTLVSILTFRERLAAGMVLWGWVPIPVESLKAKLDPEGQKTTIYWSHGMKDEIVLHENAVKGKRMLEELSVNCTLTSYEDGGHFASDQEMEAVANWLLQQLPPSSETLVGVN